MMSTLPTREAKRRGGVITKVKIVLQ